MAGDWIKMRPELLREPEVIGISHRLGVTRQHVIGCLLGVWGVGDQHAVSRICPDGTGTIEGHLSRYGMDDIDREAGHDGFAAAMEAEGWLIRRDDGISFPEWDAHNSRSAKTRACESKKKQKQRAGEAKLSTKVSQVCPDDTGTKQGTREEKRREEEVNTLSPAPSQGRPTSKQEVLDYAKSHVAHWPMPPGCEAQVFRDKLIYWVASRFKKHGTWYDEISWDATVKTFGYMKPEQWSKMLEEGAVKGNLHLATYKASQPGQAPQGHPPRSTAKELTAP